MILTFFCFYCYYAVYIFYCVVLKEARVVLTNSIIIRQSHIGSILTGCL